ncbi:MAG: dienelactone hydrolase family protein [Bacteroidales bacterium]|nr:dienelactone hydrolase family protein [Bacteroidales bacterium]
MKKIIILLVITIAFLACNQNQSTDEEQFNSFADSGNSEKTMPEKVYFPSLDSLKITANLYHLNDSAPVIVLCHQARFNKFEYDGIALKLLGMGYNCLAVDQRSGGPISSQKNETYLEALKKGKSTDYIDAEQDIIASVNYVSKKYSQPVILWGSSYSSTLALYIGLENEIVKAVIAFSPGNYLSEAKGSLIDKMKDFKKPFFVTSSKPEAAEVKELLSKVTLSDKQVRFVPESNGNHGSRALWESQEGAEEYWKALLTFLSKLK